MGLNNPPPQRGDQETKEARKLCTLADIAGTQPHPISQPSGYFLCATPPLKDTPQGSEPGTLEPKPIMVYAQFSRQGLTPPNPLTTQSTDPTRCGQSSFLQPFAGALWGRSGSCRSITNPNQTQSANFGRKAMSTYYIYIYTYIYIYIHIYIYM